MNQSQIDALPNDPAKLKIEIARQADIIASFEAAKRQRAAEEAIAAESPAATFEIQVFEVRADLEGLSDGSIDIADPLERGRICRSAVNLLKSMLAALPRA